MTSVSQNNWADWAESWYRTSRQLVDFKLYKWGHCRFLGALHGGILWKFKNDFFSQNQMLDWADIWYGASGQLVELKLYK